MGNYLSGNSVGTFRLFKKLPSFLDGVSAMLDFAPSRSRYNYDSNENQADINSLRADWFAIGKDLKEVIDIEQKNNRYASR